jgi:diphthine-ammonia ligase
MASLTRLKVIALISGGKDSLYSILHCLKNGHEVVALGNLYPAGNDPDSAMYQTVGHEHINLYEDALGIPLYRQEISGSDIHQAREYDFIPDIPSSDDNSPQNDEVESITVLLRRIMKQHPEANAVCSGAILSTYQRTRIESVALRLALIPLAYLWQYPLLPPYSNISLLEDMHQAGQDSRIVKVSSGGLGRNVLWKNIADPSTASLLVESMAFFGIENGAVLGEGGEFETLSVDGPAPLWKKSININYTGFRTDSGGTVYYALLEKVGTSEKKGSNAANPSFDSIRIPRSKDAEIEGALQRHRDSSIAWVWDKSGIRTIQHVCTAPITGLSGSRWTFVGLEAPKNQIEYNRFIMISDLARPK